MPSSRRKATLLIDRFVLALVAAARFVLMSAILFQASLLAQVSITIGSGTMVEANNTNVCLSGNWTNNGTFSPGTGSVVFNGNTTQTISGTVPTTFSNLTVKNAAGVNLDAPATVNSVLTLVDGLLTTTTQTITFGTSAVNPVEINSSRIVGTALMSARAVGAGSLSFLGVGIAAGSDNIGDVSITRVTGPDGVITVGSNSGIACNWNISVGSQPASGRSVTFSWLSNLDNEEDMSAATVYREDAGGWLQVGDVTNAGSSELHTITVNGVTQFSRWTVSGSSLPLPIQLASFCVSVIRDKDVEVAWKTASEKNSYGFEAYRRYLGVKSSNGQLRANVTTAGDTAWTKVRFVAGHGTTLQPQSYSFVDAPNKAGYYEYRLKQIDLDGMSAYVGTVEVEVGLPKTITLYQNYPNPFNPLSTIGYALPKQSYVTLKVYDMLGRIVHTLVDEKQDSGLYEMQFDASGFASGVYFYRLTAGSFVDTKKMLVLK